MNWVEKGLIDIQSAVSEVFEIFNSRITEADYDAGIYQDCFCFETYFDDEFYTKLGKVSSILGHKMDVEVYPYSHEGSLTMRVSISPIKKL